MGTFCLLAQDNVSGELVGGFVALWIILWVIGIAATIFWLWMLIDALTHEPTTNDKILWVLVICFLHFIGRWSTSSSAARAGGLLCGD